MVGNVLHPIVFSHYIILRGRDIAAIEDMVDNGDSGISEIVESTDYLLAGGDNVLLRLYRHAGDEYSVHYLDRRRPLLDLVLA